jgi:hypothetical protein
MTDSAELLVSINRILRDTIPGTTQVVRRRIAADIHSRLKDIVRQQEHTIKQLGRDIATRDKLLVELRDQHRNQVRRAAARAAQLVEQEYAEESNQPH